MKRLVTLGLTTMSVLLAASAANAQRSTSTAQATEPSGGIEEVVVTARKREENLLETPVAITAFTSKDIETRGITSISDLAAQTPGFSMDSTITGSGRNDRSFPAYILRGMVPVVTSAPTTSIFSEIRRQKVQRCRLSPSRLKT